ncbi:MAG TPA: hypothetical protein VGG44_10390 [Tepidisphaeraceae bacterium]|jgi:hypothetical protein
MQSDYLTCDHLNIEPAQRTPELILLHLKGTMPEYISDSDRTLEKQGISSLPQAKSP